MAIKQNRIIQREERDKKIAQMDLIEIKKYLCMKYGQNPERCRDCQSIKGCPAGQRVMVLLSEIEAQKQADKHEEPIDFTSKKGMTFKQMSERSRMCFERVLQQPDMVQYLIDSEGIARTTARNRLIYWASKHPDLSERYDFRTRFEAERKRVFHTSRMDQQREQAIRMFNEAATQPDPVVYIMQTYGQSREKAHKNWRNWQMRYEGTENDYRTRQQPTQEDEISVEDFLKETAVEQPEEPEEQPVERVAFVPTVQVAEDSKPCQIVATVSNTQPDFYGELNAKFQQLKLEKEKLAERLAWIEKAQESLVMTMNLFNPESAIHKDLLG